MAPRQEPQMFGAAPNNPALEVGFFLKRERETRGLSVDTASDATGIHPYHIDAIESGDLTHMPPRMEAMEMIAVYGQYLGFEPEPLIDHLLTFMPAPSIVKKPHHPAQPHVLSSAKILSFGKMPKVPNFSIRIADFPGGLRGLLTTTSAAVVMLLGAHFALSHQSLSIAPAAKTEQLAAAPVAVATPVQTAQADVKVTDQPLPTGPKIAGITAPAVEEPDAIGNLIKDQGKEATTKTKPVKLAAATGAKIQDRLIAADPVKTASTAAIPQPSAGRIYGAENKDAHLILKALAPVYLRVEDSSGVPIIAQMMNTGDQFYVPNREGLMALSRDGGRLAYQIDGQDKGTLGTPGKILVGEKLDIAALQAKK